MIIDSHAHYGYTNIFDTSVTEEKLLETIEKNGVDACIIQPLPVTTSEEAIKLHHEIFELTMKYPKRFYGLASMNPHLEEKQVRHEIEKCIKEYGFVGIKCHTIGHSVNPLSKDGDLLFNLANELGVTINVHSGNGLATACPSLNILKARQYPELRIVIAHAGMHILASEAFVAAKECSNIYLETSWTPAEDIEWFINDLGSEKIMMGSDIYNKSCYNQSVELNKYKILNISEKDRDNCLFRTANNVFKLGLL
jgi:predicted TIM-barrel fold metal-dependent hydrolase